MNSHPKEVAEPLDWVSPAIALGCVAALAAYGLGAGFIPLWIMLVLGGVPVVWELGGKLLRGEFSSDLLAAISIVLAVVLGHYVAAVIVVLMASGGEAIEAFAVRSASSVLAALARRMPSIAHRRREGKTEDISVADIQPDDHLVVYPHEVCPVDGFVVEGRGAMDESFLTGEPYEVHKTPGVAVISGALNGAGSLTIRATRRAADSRYAQIMRVMEDSQQKKPRLRRLGDQIGAWYTPLALAVAAIAALIAWDATRFLAVIIAATPCPLLIAIPTAIVGAVSLSARRGIIIKDPSALEAADSCTTLIFDKTGTLTYGRPELTEQLTAPGFAAEEILPLVAAVERTSKHPLATAVLRFAGEHNVVIPEASEVHEPPGAGLQGVVNGRQIEVTGRKTLLARDPQLAALLPPQVAGLECLILLDGRFAATYRFRDAPRKDSKPILSHFGRKHAVRKMMLVSGDREAEVRKLAETVGIEHVYAEQSPEEKLAIVKRENAAGPTIFVGDGINDAPALAAATIGIAFGAANDITGAAADVVVLDSSLAKVDEFLHISRRMRSIALQSALGGIGLSLTAMAVAAFGYLPPIAGAVFQEVIDVISVLNAVRTALPPRELTDFEET